MTSVPGPTASVEGPAENSAARGSPCQCFFLYGLGRIKGATHVLGEALAHARYRVQSLLQPLQFVKDSSDRQEMYLSDL